MSLTEKLKTTPLKEEHEKLGARMVDFAGWLMPVQYEGLMEEHKNVRENCGLFDVSHMGEIRVKGSKSLETLQWLTTNDVSKLQQGDAQYSLYPNENGGIVDDLFIYCIDPNKEYLLCVNASNADKDFEFMQKNNKGAEITNESAKWGQIAVQGPKAMGLIRDCFGPGAVELQRNQFREFSYNKSRVLVARTGYTGEDGVEIFVPTEVTAKLWQELFARGRPYGAKPIGLGARDTLRTEMKYSLYGHEIDDTTNPFEAGLGWVVKPEAKDFLGKVPMMAVKERGLTKKLVGFELIDKGIPRQGYGLFSFDNEAIGTVTSGTMSPSSGASIGIGYVDMRFAAEGTEFAVDIRGRKTRAKVVKTPFVRRATTSEKEPES